MSVVATSLRFLCCLAVGAAAMAQDPTSARASKLSIQVGHPSHAVSPTLYGLMTEEINYSYDGGLYAELVRNRTFEHDWSGVQHWNTYERGSGRASMTADTTDGPSDALRNSVRIDVKQADASDPAGIRNEGYWGMRVDPHSTFTGSFYTKAAVNEFGPITVSLISNRTGVVAASATISKVTTQWAKYEFTLHTGSVQASAENHVVISAQHPGTFWLQLVSLFPKTYLDQKNGFRPDLMEMMSAMHPQFLRLPGGNYLEGNKLQERFDWKTTIGPDVDRPTHLGPWGYQSSDGMGLLEFLKWCEDLHVEPVLALFAGYTLNHEYVKPGPSLQPYVDDGLDELEFVTGDASTKWGKVRAQLGHQKPFALRYVEVGNEDEFDSSGSYEGRYSQFYRAIKQKYPSLSLIATTPLKHFRPDLVDDHYYKRANEFFDFNKHYDNADRSGPKIFVGEWATREGSPTTNMGAALGDASWMTAMERNSDLIILASYAPLFVNVNPGGMQWESDLIGYDAFSAYGSPSYYAQCMFGEYLGDQYLPGATDNAGGRFFYSATKSSKAGKVYLKLVNASSEALPLDITLDGAANVSRKARLVTLHGTNDTDTNTLSDPRRIAPKESDIEVASHFDHIVPAYSVQVLVIDAK